MELASKPKGPDPVKRELKSWISGLPADETAGYRTVCFGTNTG